MYFFHDPEFDVSYRGAKSLFLKIYQGEVGYIEFAGKVMQVAHAIIFDDGTLNWQGGSRIRFDENGLADQTYLDAMYEALAERIFSRNPDRTSKSADRVMRERRANSNKDMMHWNKNPALRKRLDDYILSGIKHERIKTTRGLTRVIKEGV
jgi:hypothetical protein